jgi:hypothetical protein
MSFVTTESGSGSRGPALGSLAWVVFACFASFGCVATSWRSHESVSRSVKTVLVARSTPPAEVFVDGRNVGWTPLSLPCPYQAESRRETRDVTLWQSRPDLAVALTILTAGVYLPVSLVPVARQSRVEDMGFAGDTVDVRLEAEGFVPWESSVALAGAPEHTIDVELEAASPPSSEAP